jgi:hypothetical protein
MTGQRYCPVFATVEAEFSPVSVEGPGRKIFGRKISYHAAEGIGVSALVERCNRWRDEAFRRTRTRAGGKWSTINGRGEQ